ncbi:MAG TPA: hypothetical protein VG389_08270 [Myxococcota bacterium]|jgi:hypothetical protein|nr:hypothetical protein [Myxococcota bacterium]
MRLALYWAGVLVALGAVVLGLAGADVGVKAAVNPLSGLALAAGSLALLKASELHK